MPPKSKTSGKGGKGHKRAKNGGSAEAQVKELVLRADGQVYGKVCKMLGNGRVSCKVFLETGEKMLMCIIPGKFRKRMWINPGDLVLVGVRSYQDDKADILYKYSAVEAKRLVRLGEVPLTESDINDGESDQTNDNAINDNIQWGGEEDQKEKEKEANMKKKKSVTINENGSYINEDLLPPTSDDEDGPKKKVTNGRLNRKGNADKGPVEEVVEESTSKETTSEAEDDEAEGEDVNDSEESSEVVKVEKTKSDSQKQKYDKTLKTNKDSKSDKEINLDDL